MIGWGDFREIGDTIRVSKYDDNGTPRYYTEVRASNIVFLEKKKEEPKDETPPRKTRPRAA